MRTVRTQPESARPPSGGEPLPTTWRRVRLGDVCNLNPSRPRGFVRDDAAPTTFVPMSAVDERTGTIAGPELRPYGELKKGYTYFGEGDVLFAKITPCMQNGKHAIARGLTDGIGFGSTEFHVIRPGPEIIPEWVHFFIRQPSVLQAATAYFYGAVGQQRVPEDYLGTLEIPLPPLAEQKRIAAILNEQMAVVERARAATAEQIEAVRAFHFACIRQSLADQASQERRLADCLVEVANGVGSDWVQFRVLGATRDGLAPAKERVGRQPERYKYVDGGTIFYNPMRILIGSIAMVDEGDSPGITSPDYVVLKTRAGVLHHRWFYYWLRSCFGEHFIKSLARGAVRERMLFRRLASGVARLPSWRVQCAVADRLKATRSLYQKTREQLEQLDALPAALLRRAFSGDL